LVVFRGKSVGWRERIHGCASRSLLPSHRSDLDEALSRLFAALGSPPYWVFGRAWV
jgi:hypothetical protein